MVQLQKYTKHFIKAIFNHKCNRNFNVHSWIPNRCYAGGVQGIDMTYTTYGEHNPTASPLIIMHGLYGSKQNWKSATKALAGGMADKRQIYCVDARNHGESPHSPNHSYIDLAEDVAQFHRRHNIRKSIVMGHSMGGRCMMIFALRYPELVEKLIVVDIAPKVTELSQSSIELLLNSMLALKNLQLPNELSMGKGRERASQILSDVFPDKFVRDFILLSLYKNEDGTFAWHLNLDALYNNFHNIKDFPNPKNQQYNGPVLFLGGTKSDFIDPSEFPLYQQTFPNSRLEMIEAGHLIHFDNSKTFVRLVLEFIN